MLVGYTARAQPDRNDLENAIEVAFREPAIAKCVYSTPGDGLRKATIYADSLFLKYFPGRYDSDRTSELSITSKKAGIYVVRDGLIYGEADIITTLERMDISVQCDTIQLEFLTSSITKGAYPCMHLACTLSKAEEIWKVTVSDEVVCDERERPPLGVVDLR